MPVEFFCHAPRRSDHILLKEVRQLRGIGAQAQNKINMMLRAQLIQRFHHRTGAFQLRVAELQESVHKYGSDVKIGAQDAAQEADKHIRAVNMIVIGVYKANVVVHVKHITIVVIQEDHVVCRVLGCAVGQVNEPLRFAGAFPACDYLYHGNPLLYGFLDVTVL